MNNFEWLKKTINEMSAEEFNRFWYEHNEPWCSDDCCCNYDTCSDCMMDWTNQPYINPMPELEVGMFVECNTSVGKSFGIILWNNSIVFQNGFWASGDNEDWRSEHLTKIFNKEVVCFDMCEDRNVIWRRD